MRIRMEPQDEYMHPLEEASNFNESMYFNVYAPTERIGGFLRLGNRANEGYAELKRTQLGGCHPTDGCQFLVRAETGGVTTVQRTDLNKALMPYWLKLVRAGDLLVVNDSRVINARLFVRKETGARVELFFLAPGETPGVLRDMVR